MTRKNTKAIPMRDRLFDFQRLIASLADKNQRALHVLPGFTLRRIAKERCVGYNVIEERETIGRSGKDAQT